MTHPCFQSFSHVGRQWLRRSRPDHVQSVLGGKFNFTVLSYNVLADELLFENRYLYSELLDLTPHFAFEWEYRKRNLLREIAHANADVVCLQEVQENHYFDWFAPIFTELGYEGYFKKRTGSKPDGCASFFKKNSFLLKSCHPVEYLRPNIPVLDRDNIGLVLVLAPKCSRLKRATPICVANTHLLFNQKRGDVKLAQLAVLLAEIDRTARASIYPDVASSNGYIPVILCGDLNSTPYSPLYNFITQGSLKFRGQARASISGQLDGRRSSGPYVVMDVDLWPPCLNLTYACQWKDVLAEKGQVSDLTVCNNKEASCAGGQAKRSGFEADLGSSGRSKKLAHREREPDCLTSVDPVEVSSDMRVGGQIVRATEASTPSPARCSSAYTRAPREDCALVRASTGSVGDPIIIDEQCAVTINDDPLSPSACSSVEGSTTAASQFEEPGHLRHQLSLLSAYSHFTASGLPEVSTCHGSGALNVDYIFYTPCPTSCCASGELRESGTRGGDLLSLTGVLGLMSRTQLEAMNKLPNAVLSSDHLSLLASFILS